MTVSEIKFEALREFYYPAKRFMWVYYARSGDFSCAEVFEAHNPEQFAQWCNDVRQRYGNRED